MKKFRVNIEEHYVASVIVEAETIEDAEEIAETNYICGDYKVDTSGEAQAALIEVEEVEGIQSTGWIEVFVR